jgi:hypothetical protein
MVMPLDHPRLLCRQIADYPQRVIKTASTVMPIEVSIPASIRCTVNANDAY